MSRRKFRWSFGSASVGDELGHTGPWVAEVEARCHVQSNETTHLILPNHVSRLYKRICTIDVERAVLLVELERRADYWSLFARRCVGGRKQQREQSNCNYCGKTGATSKREKSRDDPTGLGVVIFAEVGVFARPLTELVAPPTVRHHAETPATMIAYLMVAEFRLSHHALARQFDGISLR